MTRTLQAAAIDVNGLYRPIWLGINDATTGRAALGGLEALTNDGIVGGGDSGTEDISLGGAAVGPVSDSYSTVQDFALMEFDCQSGPYLLRIPGPKVAIFKSDGFTVDRGSILVTNFVASAITSLRTPWDEPLIELIRGWRGYSGELPKFSPGSNVPYQNKQLSQGIPFGSWIVRVRDVLTFRSLWLLWSRESGATLKIGMLPALQAVTDCRIQSQEKTQQGLDPSLITVPIDANYRGNDILRIRFMLQGNNRVDLLVPGPKQTVLTNNNRDLDLTNPDVLAFEALAVAGLNRWRPNETLNPVDQVTNIELGIRETRQDIPSRRDLFELSYLVDYTNLV